MVHLFLLRQAGQPLRRAGAAPLRHAAARAHRPHAGLGGGARRAASSGAAHLARVLRPTEADERAAQQMKRAQPRVRRDHARAAVLRRGRLRHARRGRVLQRLHPRLSPVDEFLVPLSERAAARIRDVRLTQLAWHGHRRSELGAVLTRSQRAQPPPVNARRRQGGDAAPPRRRRGRANPAFSGGRYQVALIEATCNSPATTSAARSPRSRGSPPTSPRSPGYTAESSRARSTCALRALQGRLAKKEPPTRRRASSCGSCATGGGRHEASCSLRGAAAPCARRGCSWSLSIVVARGDRRGGHWYVEREKRDSAASGRKLQEARARVEGARRERENLSSPRKCSARSSTAACCRGATPRPGRARQRAAHPPPLLASTTRSRRSGRCRWPADGRSPPWTCSRAA